MRKQTLGDAHVVNQQYYWFNINSGHYFCHYQDLQQFRIYGNKDIVDYSDTPSAAPWPDCMVSFRTWG